MLRHDPLLDDLAHLRVGPVVVVEKVEPHLRKGEHVATHHSSVAAPIVLQLAESKSFAAG